MRSSCLALAALAAAVLADPAGAETRIFVIANNAGGYGAACDEFVAIECAR